MLLYKDIKKSNNLACVTMYVRYITNMHCYAMLNINKHRICKITLLLKYD